MSRGFTDLRSISGRQIPPQTSSCQAPLNQRVVRANGAFLFLRTFLTIFSVPWKALCFSPTCFVGPSQCSLLPHFPQCKVLKLSLDTLLFAYYVPSLEDLINDQGFTHHVLQEWHLYLYLHIRPLCIPEPCSLQHICYFQITFDLFSTPFLSS